MCIRDRLGAILFSALLAPLWARLIVRPVQEMAGQMKEMIAGNYWKQVPRGHVAELNQFAANLEQMAEVIL